MAFAAGVARFAEDAFACLANKFLERTSGETDARELVRRAQTKIHFAA